MDENLAYGAVEDMDHISNKARKPLQSSKLTRPGPKSIQSRDENLLWLDKNENTDTRLNKIVKKILVDLPVKTIYSYPNCASLYSKLAFHLGVDPDNLILTNGSDGAIRAVFEAFIQEGDTVLVPKPTFAMYSVNSQILGANIIEVSYAATPNGPSLCVEVLTKAILEYSPKLIGWANPGSPTGTYFSPQEMEQVLIAAERVGSILLVDEAYFPFCPNSILPRLTDYPNLIIARSTAKAWGLAGFRIGFAIAQKDTIEILHKAKPMYEVGSIAVSVFERMLDFKDEVAASVERLKEGMHYFLQEMREVEFQVLESHGNFVFVKFGDRAAQVHAALCSTVLYRKDFQEPCLKGYSRFSATTKENFKQIVDVIKSALELRKEGK